MKQGRPNDLSTNKKKQKKKTTMVVMVTILRIWDVRACVTHLADDRLGYIHTRRITWLVERRRCSVCNNA